MVRKSCTLRRKEISRNPDFTHYDFSKFSIELELIGLSSELEHYDVVVEPEQFFPSLAAKPNALRNVQSWSMPLFLRL